VDVLGNQIGKTGGSWLMQVRVCVWCCGGVGWRMHVQNKGKPAPACML
jgi:hypothetical protein